MLLKKYLSLLFIALLLLFSACGHAPDLEKPEDEQSLDTTLENNLSFTAAEKIFVDFNITLHMTAVLDESSIDSGSVVVSDADGNSVVGESSYDAQRQSLIFTPEANLSEGRYSISVDKNIKTAAQKSLVEPLQGEIEVVAYPEVSEVVGVLKTELAQDVAIEGDFAYLSDSRAGLYSIYIGDPLKPHVTDSIKIDSARKLFIDGVFAYVTNESGVSIVDISDPSSLQLIGKLKVAGAQGVYATQNYLYITDNKSLKIIDIPDKSSAKVIGGVEIANARDIVLSANYAYVVYSGGIKVVDISDSSAPMIVKNIATSYAQAITILDNFAYVADFDSGLKIIDISKPAEAKVVGKMVTDLAYDVAVSKNFAYVADSSFGLKIIDINDTNAPTITQRVETEYANSVATSGNFAYVADGAGGLKIINIQMNR